MLKDHTASVQGQFDRLRRFQPVWAALSYPQRAKLIRGFRDLLLVKTEELADILTREVGKPRAQSFREIRGAVERIDFFLENTEAALKSEIISKEEIIEFEPLGVIANISAWNYPYLVGTSVFIPALLTGNTVLYKPSEFASLTGFKIQELMHEAGIPSDAFTALIGNGRVGQELLAVPVDGVFFTGSYATGLKVAKACAAKMISVQLELGGKDPVYVCDDVNLAWAAEQIADGVFYNAGQSCCAVERVYVQNSIHDGFIEQFLIHARKLKLGEPFDESTTLGPLTRSAQVDLLEAQVKDAVSKGARLLCGGTRAEFSDRFFPPTVLMNVNSSMRVMQEESFGPIIGIQRVEDDEEAIRQMNDTQYGLTASVFSGDETRARSILSRVNTGTAYWNCCDRVSPRLPWSGRKNSGTGSTLSKRGIQAFLRPKAWHLRMPVAN